MNGPADVAVADDGRIYVREMQGHKITMLSPDGRIMGSWGSAGTGEGQFDFLERGLADYDYNVGGLAINGDTVFVADENRVQSFGLDGTYRDSWSSRGRRPGQVLMPEALATGPDGNLYLVDAKLKNVQVFTPQGKFVRRWPLQMRSRTPFPSHLCLNADGQVFVVELERAGAPGLPSVHLHKYSADGQLLGRWSMPRDDDGKSDDGEFVAGANGLACASDGTLYLSDVEAQRVQAFDSAGKFLFSTPGIEGEFALTEGNILIVANDDSGTVAKYQLNR